MKIILFKPRYKVPFFTGFYFHLLCLSTGNKVELLFCCRETDVTLPVPGAGFISSHPTELGYVQYSGIPQCPDGMGQGSYVTDQFGNTRPTWYDPYSSRYVAVKWDTCIYSTNFGFVCLCVCVHVRACVCAHICMSCITACCFSHTCTVTLHSAMFMSTIQSPLAAEVLKLVQWCDVLKQIEHNSVCPPVLFSLSKKIRRHYFLALLHSIVS